MLSRAIDSYLAIRRATGFQMKVQGGLLRHFARYAADRSQTHVCRQTAIDWAAQAPSPYQRENRLSSVRLFARHARAEDARHDLIPRQVFAGRRRRTFPTILSPVIEPRTQFGINRPGACFARPGVARAANSLTIP